MTQVVQQPRFGDRPVRARIVLNPRAGHGEGVKSINAAKQLWEAHGWNVEVTPTVYAGHAIDLAREAAQAGYNLVVAAGGDGTVNEVINGIAGSQAALAVLPVGTGNVWGREIQLPLDPREAAQALLHGELVQLDLGSANGRYFLLMAGIGFDAAVTRAVPSEAKRKLGLMAYIVQALRTARDVRGTRVHLVIDGRSIRARALMIVIGNSRLYGAFLQITHHASLTDGLLDVSVIMGQDVRSAPLHLLSIFLRRYNLNPDMSYYRAREVSVSSATPLDVQVDGDPIGQTPMVFRIEPRALKALIPSWAVASITGPAMLRLPLMDRIRRIRISGS